MGWIAAFIVIAVAVAALVGGAVLHPVLYGLLVAGLFVVPIWLGASAVDGIIGSIFGKRK